MISKVNYNIISLHWIFKWFIYLIPHLIEGLMPLHMDSPACSALIDPMNRCRCIKHNPVAKYFRAMNVCMGELSVWFLLVWCFSTTSSLSMRWMHPLLSKPIFFLKSSSSEKASRGASAPYLWTPSPFVALLKLALWSSWTWWKTMVVGG